jgi:hypothetical protein
VLARGLGRALLGERREEELELDEGVPVLECAVSWLARFRDRFGGRRSPEEKQLLESAPSVFLDPETVAKCARFASLKCHEQYEDTEQSDVETLRSQWLVGSMGEFGVALLLKQRGVRVKEPSTLVLAGRKRAFAPDLVVLRPDPSVPTGWSKTPTGIHVKSCDVRSPHRLSAVVQKDSVTGRSDKALLAGNPNEYVAFAAVDDVKAEVWLAGILPCAALGSQLPFEAPEKLSLQRYKYAVYYDRLLALDAAQRFVWPVGSEHDS